MAAPKRAASTNVTLVCKERRCGRSFTIELAELLDKAGKATCPYCARVSRFKTAEYMTLAPNLDKN